MSFAVETLPNVNVTTVDQPTAGSTVTSGTVAITDTATSTDPVVVGGNAVAALATVGAGVTLIDKASVTVGTDAAGNLLDISGATVDAENANGVIVSLDSGNAGNGTVAADKLPDVIKSAGISDVNTYTKLSTGDDQYSGTKFNDAVQVSAGQDVIVTGDGSDIVSATKSLEGGKSEVTLGAGEDQVLLTKDALATKGKIAISDFSKKEDVITLDVKKSKVSGIGTDTLKISTKDGKSLKIESDGSKFKKSSIEFI